MNAERPRTAPSARDAASGRAPALGEAGRELVSRRPRGEELEVYEKRGRSRRFAHGVEGESFEQSTEAGWAARGGDTDGSYFVSGTGAPPARFKAVDGGDVRRGAPIRLPPLFAQSTWVPPTALDAPLATESEGFALLSGIARELARDVPGALARRLVFEDGASSWALASSLGVAATGRGRGSSLRVEAELAASAPGGREPLRVAAEFVAHSAAELKPLGVARRLADRLLALRREAPPPASAEAQLVLAPPLAARLLESLAPRFVGHAAWEAMRAIEDADGRVAGGLVTLIDDGGDPRGALAAAVDGEGVPCRPQRLVDAGRFVSPLLAWWQSADANAASGISLRPGWRDLPRPGPTQLFFEPGATPVGELVGSVANGAYLLAAEGGVRLLGEDDEFVVVVSGFALERGRATGGLGPCRLRGRFGGFLAGISAVGRDLAFVPGRALYGSPTLVVSGLALEPLGDDATSF